MRQAEGREELCIDSASAWPQLATAERWGAAMLRGVPWKSTKEEAACWAKAQVGSAGRGATFPSRRRRF